MEETVCCLCGEELTDVEIIDNERSGDIEMPVCFDCLNDEVFDNE